MGSQAMAGAVKSGSTGSWIRDLRGWGGLCALTLLAYGPALGAGFVWDDDAHVPKAAMRSLHGLWRMWFELGSTQQYYPALFSTFWLEHRLWGDAASGYHLVNILLHATSAWLFGKILRRLAIPGAWLGALIFALHPVCVESVAWISEQKNTLSTLFYLLAALAYLRFDENRDRSKGTWWLATLLFVLALLSKTVTATLPAAILVVFWWKRGRLSWKADFLPLTPWLGLGAASGLFSAWVERAYIGAQGTGFALDAVQRCLVAGRAIWFYLGKLLWPANLIFIYPHWRVDAAEAWQDLLPLGAVALIAALWLMRRRTRAPLAALLFFTGSLFPTLGFFNVYAFLYSYVTDHWQYLASLGIIALAAGGWGTWARKAAIPDKGGARSAPGFRATPIGIPQLLAVAVVCLLGILTWRQCRAYRDMETFYRAILDRNPDCWMAHTNLGATYQGDGDWAKATEQFQEALRLKPDDAQVHNNLGEAWLRIPERLNDAIGQLRQALRLNPNLAEAHNNLALGLARIPGSIPEAIAQYEQAVRLKPDYAEAHNSLAIALAQVPGRMADAITHFEDAVRFKPDYAEAHHNLAIALARIPGRLPEALAHYEEALRLRPNYAEAHNNLAIALAQIPGRLPEALAHYEEALRLKPEYAEAHNNLAAALGQIPGRLPDAIEHFEEALRLEPDDPGVHYNLALAYGKMGRLDEAVRQLEQALRLNPDFGEARAELDRLNGPAGAIPAGP
jgi:tetratricopeptide (TPR) repeat protein